MEEAAMVDSAMSELYEMYYDGGECAMHKKVVCCYCTEEKCKVGYLCEECVEGCKGHEDMLMPVNDKEKFMRFIHWKKEKENVKEKVKSEEVTKESIEEVYALLKPKVNDIIDEHMKNHIGKLMSEVNGKAGTGFIIRKEICEKVKVFKEKNDKKNIQTLVKGLIEDVARLNNCSRKGEYCVNSDLLNRRINEVVGECLGNYYGVSHSEGGSSSQLNIMMDELNIEHKNDSEANESIKSRLQQLKEKMNHMK